MTDPRGDVSSESAVGCAPCNVVMMAVEVWRWPANGGLSVCRQERGQGVDQGEDKEEAWRALGGLTCQLACGRDVRRSKTQNTTKQSLE